MCGILGQIGAGATVDVARFEQALDLLAHRGPDDRGVLSDGPALLGHRRLSILDLSPAGHQPMVEPDSGAAIVFNGEIYNYLELRRELTALGYTFRSNSDTEVLLRAFLHWGHDCLRRLNGMWAFAIWEPRNRRLFLARDRFGVKPLYYRLDGSLCFASEPKAILHLFPGCRTVDTRTLAEFLAWGRLYVSGASFYRGIGLLPPAHCAEYDADSGAFRVWRYWDYPADRNLPAESWEHATEAFSALLDDAVRIRLRSDVPVGITLSGGLDSSAVLAASAKSAQTVLPCFTAVYDAAHRGEAQWAAIAAEPYGIQPIEVPAPKHQWTDLLTQIAWHMDGPGYSPAVFPLWTIMAEARRRGVPVLLEGQGADEALGGYPQYMTLAILAELGRAAASWSAAPVGRALALSRGAARTFSARWLGLWLVRETFPFLKGWYRSQVGAASTLRNEYALPAGAGAKECPDRYRDRVNNRLWMDHSARILPGLLHYGDAVSMAHSIESRLPFMDYRLVEWLFSQPADIKLGDGRTKRILRDYQSRNQQARIAARVDKQGFPTPAEQWLAQDNGAILRDTLLGPEARIREFCQPAAIERLVDFHCRGGRGAGNHLYRLVSTELWLRRCIQ